MTPVTGKPLILYDGVCNFCNAVVKFVIEKDRQEKFSFAPIQSREARAVLRENNEAFASLKTIYLVEGSQTFKRSRAVFRIFSRLPMPWRIVAVLGYLPVPFTDLCYKLVAKYRYRLFGKSQDVQVPYEGLKHRFINFQKNV
jgi:predicted DCC family thiol-disulfide oxidoreductase YuxK